MTAPNTPKPELERYSPFVMDHCAFMCTDIEGEYYKCADVDATLASLTAEGDRYKFNADELRKSWKRQAERYQRTIAEHIDRSEAAERRVKELEGELASRSRWENQP